MKCFMGCEPPDGGGQEQFYVAVLPELTIYGHTINQFTREEYPEDWPLVQDVQARGIYWGCWHSEAMSDGEIGSQDPAICVSMERVTMWMHLEDLTPYEAMNLFAEKNWPDLKRFVGFTSVRPVATIYEAPEGVDFFDAIEQGLLRETWNSLSKEDDGGNKPKT